jgi:hypothetical protein
MTPTLDELVVACLDRLEDEGPSAVDAVCREHPALADALRSRLATLQRAGLLDGPDGGPDAGRRAGGDAMPERLGEFRLLRRLGGGGMGVVYEAVQEPLGRTVALKLIRPEQLWFPESRERFRREVQLVARLQHPGIVPIYTVGEERGVPYFAMERLHGATLGEVLALVRDPRRGRDMARALQRAAAVHAASEGGEAPQRAEGAVFEGSWADACARVAACVARALAHAHARDVLHRDVKPSNVFVTLDGRVMLFDFGLASSRDTGRVTGTRAQVGSLAYMAPEQVRGETLDERTDVYGVGATLCELLTLAPPHGELRAEALTAAILRGDPVPLRRRAAGLSRDLETVCLKALEHRPERRYASVDALARDLEAVLARRPVAARRIGPLGRARRWVARHPARAAALALAVLGPSALAVQQAVSARRLARQTARAEANLDSALEALQTFLWEVGRDQLRDVPRMEPVRLRLLEQALVTLHDLMPQRPDDPDLLRRWGRLRRSTGEVLAALDRYEEACAAFRDALSVLPPAPEAGATAGGAPGVAAADVVPDAAALERAGTLNALANALEKLGRLPEAADAWTGARAALSRPADEAGLASLLHVERNLARVLGRLGRHDQAEALYTEALAGAERLAGLAGGEAGARLELAAVLNGHAARRIEAGDLDGARPLHARALPLLLELAEAAPDDREVLHEAAIACMNAPDLAPPESVEGTLRRGLELAGSLASDFPHTPEYRRVLGSLRMNLAIALLVQGRVEEAEGLLQDALDLAQELVRVEPDVFDNLFLAGKAGMNLATLRVQLERRAEACEPGAAAGETLTAARALAPDDSRVLRALAWAHLQEGYGRVATGEGARAEALAEAAVGASRDDPMVQVAAAEVLAGCVRLDPARAQALRTAALDRLERGLLLGFPDLDYLRRCRELEPVRALTRFEALLAAAAAEPAGG